MEGIVAIPRVDFVLHSKGGWTQPVSFVDSNGAAIDISGETYHLKTDSLLDIALTADPANPTGLLITLSEANIATIFALDSHSCKYALVDVGQTPDEVLAFGRLIVEGW